MSMECTATAQVRESGPTAATELFRTKARAKQVITTEKYGIGEMRRTPQSRSSAVDRGALDSLSLDMSRNPVAGTPTTTDGLQYPATPADVLGLGFEPAARYSDLAAQGSPMIQDGAELPVNGPTYYYEPEDLQPARPEWDTSMEHYWQGGTVTPVPLQQAQPELHQQPQDLFAASPAPQPQRWQYPLATDHLPPQLTTHQQPLYTAEEVQSAASPPTSAQPQYLVYEAAELNTHSPRFAMGDLVDSPHLGMSPTVAPLQRQPMLPVAPALPLQVPSGAAVPRQPSKLSLQYNNPAYLQHLLHLQQPQMNASMAGSHLQQINTQEQHMYYLQEGQVSQIQQQWAVPPTGYQPQLWSPAGYTISASSHAHLGSPSGFTAPAAEDQLRIVIPSPPASVFNSPVQRTIESHISHPHHLPTLTYTPTPSSPASTPHSPAPGFSTTSSSSAKAQPRTKARWPCPRPHCTKDFSNRNGLRYHLDRGTCEHDARLAASTAPASSSSSSLLLPSSLATTSMMQQPMTAAFAVNSGDNNLPPPGTMSSPSTSIKAETGVASNVKVSRRPYWCRVCGDKSYKNLNGLKYHARTMHADLPFEQKVKGAYFGPKKVRDG
ncbi:hypothetical protein BDZ88DRAFT_504219 [Geranomyces variabilis]|nr:hypothetical protein BDZ88DRAFT_504219 [Geranomyces variabilis]KAJ3139595.1 hypothetical protein HDU90_009096 [Geranomyces variabilis]